jgi:hypothetical protein
MSQFSNRNYSALLACAIAFSLFGCASGYVEPDVGNAAAINFINSSDRPLALEIYRGASQCTDRTIVHPAVPPGESRSIKVESGELSFGAVQDISSRWTNFGPEIQGCMLATSFKPVPGRTYTYTYYQSGGACSYRLTQAGRPVPHEDRTWRRAFGESGPWCE